jgi:hypothetical protein
MGRVKLASKALSGRWRERRRRRTVCSPRKESAEKYEVMVSEGKRARKRRKVGG